MTLQEFEALIIEKIGNKVVNIIKTNPILKISAKARAGAEISDWMEQQFVESCKDDTYLKRTEGAPKGKTKNPWDSRTYFTIGDLEEEVWIDFKALKVSAADSNPDIGTPSKMIKFINDGSFYLLYVLIYYTEIEDGLEFVKREGEYIKCYYLKDINHTFRRNPKNQLQVNISAEPEQRSRQDFIDILYEKLKQSHERQIKISQAMLMRLEQEKKDLIAVNKKTESSLLNKLQRIEK